MSIFRNYTDIEKVKNWTFDKGTKYWGSASSGQITVLSGELKVKNIHGKTSAIQKVNVIAGHKYRVSFRLSTNTYMSASYSAGSERFYQKDLFYIYKSAKDNEGWPNTSIDIVATSNKMFLNVTVETATCCDASFVIIDNISVQDMLDVIPIVITTQPQSGRYDEGTTPPILHVEYTHPFATMHWQIRNLLQNKNTWEDISGATNKNYTVPGLGLTINQDGNEYRAIISDGISYKITNIAKLTVVGLRATVSNITTTPSVPICHGVLTMRTIIENAVSISWQVNSGSGFNAISGANTSSYTLHTVDNEIGYGYKVKAIGSDGVSVYSNTYTVPNVCSSRPGVGVTRNGRYWDLNGSTKLLAGGTFGGEPHLYSQRYNANSINLDDGADFLGSELTKIHDAKGNYFRCTLLVNFPSGYVPDPKDMWKTVFPFNGGKGNFNLKSVNRNWLDRVDALLYRCEALGIVVQLELFDTWWCIHNHWRADDMWWHPDQVNHTACPEYTFSNTGLPRESESTNDKFTYPARHNRSSNPLLIAQKLIVGEICKIADKHNNCFIQIENESSESKTWEDFWANFVKGHTTNTPVTSMIDDWYLGENWPSYANKPHGFNMNGDHAMRDPLYDFGDHSQQFWNYYAQDNDLDKDWDQVVTFNSKGGKPSNAVKIYSRWDRVASGEGHNKAMDYMFISFMAGGAACAFHPGDGGTEASLGTSSRALNCMRAADWLSNNCSVRSMSAVNRRDSRIWQNRPSQGAWALASNNHIAIYMTGNSSFKFNCSRLGGTMSMRWKEVNGNRLSGSGTTGTSTAKSISNPFGNVRALLVMTRR